MFFPLGKLFKMKKILIGEISKQMEILLMRKNAIKRVDQFEGFKKGENFYSGKINFATNVRRIN